MLKRNIVPRCIQKRGKAVWIVRVPADLRSPNEPARREFGQDEASAKSFARRLQESRVSLAGEFYRLTIQEQSAVIAALRAVGAQRLTELVAQAQKRAVVDASVTVRSVIGQLMAVKRAAGRDAAYLDSFEGVLNQFAAGRENVPLAEVTIGDIEKWLASKSIHYRPTLRARLSTLFRFARRRKLISENPCELVESVTVAKPPPSVFAPADFAKAMAWLVKHPRLLAWFVLSAIAGLRPDEARKTHWREINLREKFVKVESQTTKVRMRRIVYPPAQAIAWLKFAEGLKVRRKVKFRATVTERALLPLDAQVLKRDRRQLAKHLGWAKWPKDITRHTAASVMLAEGLTAGAVAEMLGNSEKVLRRDYKALITREQAKEFRAVIPPKLRVKS